MTLRRIIYTVGLFLIGTVVHGQDGHGYIDLDRVIIALSEYKTEQEMLEMRRNELRDSLEIIARTFQRMLVEIPHNVKMDSASKASLETLLNRTNKSTRDAQHQAQMELVKTQYQIDVKLRKLVTEQLKVFCASEKVVHIADRKLVLYCRDCIDFTEGFIKHLAMRAR